MIGISSFLIVYIKTEIVNNHICNFWITYPNFGHAFYPSFQWSTGFGPIEPYVLADLYAWLEAHSGLSHSYITTSTGSSVGANTSFLNLKYMFDFYIDLRLLGFYQCIYQGQGFYQGQDDEQKKGSYGRMIGEVYCNYSPTNWNSTKNFSEEMLKSGFAVILTKFCAHSEFAIESWAKKYGC